MLTLQNVSKFKTTMPNPWKLSGFCVLPSIKMTYFCRSTGSSIQSASYKQSAILWKFSVDTFPTKHCMNRFNMTVHNSSKAVNISKLGCCSCCNINRNHLILQTVSVRYSSVDLPNRIRTRHRTSSADCRPIEWQRFDCRNPPNSGTN